VFEKSYYEQLFNGEGQDEWIIPTGSIKTFFETQSYGKLTVNAHVEDWTVAPNTEEYYSFGRNGLTSMFAEVAYSALDRMDQRGFNWSDHDRNSDGVVDALFIIHSGFAGTPR
jgi:M6 family metalloprotease-like protein